MSNNLTILLESLLSEGKIIGYYGSTKPIKDFDIRKTKEFGIHIALNEPESSLHRIKHEGGFLYKLNVSYENPLQLPDVFRWTLESILRELKIQNEKIKEYKNKASKQAKENGTSLREEENVLLSKILTHLGYDAIVYDNKAESGGKAVIVWNPEQLTILQNTEIIAEMPINKIHRIGDFSKSSSIRNPVDRALLSNPKAEIKMRSIWQNSKGNFDLVFVNDPRVNKSEFREVGPVSLDFVRNKMRLSEEELPIDPDATTIIYTNNSGDQRVMSSPWILAHRLGHAINRSRERTSNDYLATLWREFTQRLTALFRDMLNNVYDLQPKVSGLTGGNSPIVTDQEIFKLAAQSLGTMKSARDNKLRSWYEFAYEVFAQYLLYGKIKLNPIPDVMLTKVRGVVKQTRRVRDISSQEMYNRHDLQYYAEELESTLDYLIDELAGTIFVM